MRKKMHQEKCERIGESDDELYIHIHNKNEIWWKRWKNEKK